MTMRSTPSFGKFVAALRLRSCSRQPGKTVGGSSPRSVAISLSLSMASRSKAALAFDQPAIGVAAPVAVAPRPVENMKSLSFGHSSMIVIASSFKGTSCARSAFVRSRGNVQSRCPRFISLQVISRLRSGAGPLRA